MKNKDKLIIKISKSVIVVFGVLTVFNVIMLVNKKSYALFQKTVETDNIIHIQTASEFPSENKGTDKLKDTVDENGGIKGVDPDNGKECTENCKEYRYVGANVNNYIYFNCDPNQAQSETTCEMWRIVGIFTDEETGEEHLKIVKDTVLTANMFPETYKIKGTEYKIKYTSGNSAHWNRTVNGGIYSNDWATAGLQYWLNTDKDDNNEQGYLSYLNEGVIDLIETTKYYLGTVTYKNNSGSNNGIKDTPKEAYANERAVNECEGEVGPDSNSSTTEVEGNNTCRVWAKNAATWEGKVGLLYPSDYGFSADSSNWNTPMNSGSFNGEPSKTSWLQSANHSSYEWLLSPSSKNSGGVTHWDGSGFVNYDSATGNVDVRPVLNLKARMSIKNGTGTLDDPYQLR